MRFRARLRGIAADIAGNNDADDILHDAFCRLWMRTPAVRTETEAIKLSYTAVRNSAIDVRRRVSAHATFSIDDSETPVADRSDDQEYEAECKDTYIAVVELSRRALSPRQFEIFRMHDIEGMDYEDIAASLSMTQENVRMTLSRARKTLRQLYRQQQQSTFYYERNKQ